jgi:hypothetical protein
VNPADTTLALPARCKLCGKEFPLPGQLYELGTTTPSPELMKFSQRISTHLANRHKDRVNLNLAIYQMYDSYSVLACFNLAGPLAKEFDKMRHQLHKHTRLLRVSDQKLMQKVAELHLISAKDQEAVLNMITEMRDMYEERGLHPEIDQAEAEAAKNGTTSVIMQ